MPTPVIRPACDTDAAAIAAIYAPYVDDSVISFEETAPDADEIRRRIGSPPLLPWLVAAEAGVVLGYAYASPHRTRAAYRWAVDVSVYLAPGARGRGLGKALYEPLMNEVRALGYVNAYAGIALPNAVSVGLHEAMGFVRVGVYRNVAYKHGRWHDVGWWHLALVDQLPDTPSEPRPWSVAAAAEVQDSAR
jgi:phosphinothricin acetyltransferase